MGDPKSQRLTRFRPGTRVHVLLIAPSQDIVGGQSVQASLLLRALGSSEQLKLTFHPIDRRLPGPLRWLQSVPILRTLLNEAWHIARLLPQLPGSQVVHIFTAGKWSFTLWTIPALLLARVLGKKTLVNYHDGRIEEHIARWQTALPALRTADAVVAPSDFVVKVLKSHGVTARCIHNVPDLERFRYRQRRRLRPALMTNRGLEPPYNVECVLRAFASIQRRYPNASLTVAHDGPCRPRLEHIARDLGLKDVVFVGRVPYSRAASLYEAADIYISSSDVDCMPLSLLESFASGVRVIATRVGGVPYMVDHERTGLLVEPGDHEAIADATIRLLADPGLVERLTAGAREELKRYDQGRICVQWLDLYAGLAGDWCAC